MDIPSPFKQIIERNYSANNKDVKKFLDSCFDDIIRELHITDYQARAAKTGSMFEYAFWYLIKKHGVELDTDFEIPKACMMAGGKLDFGLIHKGNPICGIEAKGSAENVSTRPGLKRTDTVKKAIAQAYQFKRIFPKVPFFVITNVLPTSGNAKCMVDLAEGDIIDKVVDVTNDAHLSWFVKQLKKIKSND
jgi:hypothetical protein